MRLCDSTSYGMTWLRPKWKPGTGESVRNCYGTAKPLLKYARSKELCSATVSYCVWRAGYWIQQSKQVSRINQVGVVVNFEIILRRVIELLCINVSNKGLSILLRLIFSVTASLKHVSYVFLHKTFFFISSPLYALSFEHNLHSRLEK